MTYDKEEWTGIIFKANEISRNNRVYTKESMNNQLNSDRIKQLISTKTLFGEYAYFAGKDNEYLSYLHPDKKSVIFNKIWMEDDFVHANFNCADTQYGKIVYNELCKGNPINFGIRAIGTSYGKHNILSAPAKIMNLYYLYGINDPTIENTDNSEIKIVNVTNLITFDVIEEYPYKYDNVISRKFERIKEEH